MAFNRPVCLFNETGGDSTCTKTAHESQRRTTYTKRMHRLSCQSKNKHTHLVKCCCCDETHFYFELIDYYSIAASGKKML